MLEGSASRRVHALLALECHLLALWGRLRGRRGSLGICTTCSRPTRLSGRGGLGLGTPHVTAALTSCNRTRHDCMRGPAASHRPTTATRTNRGTELTEAHRPRSGHASKSGHTEAALWVAVVPDPSWDGHVAKRGPRGRIGIDPGSSRTRRWLCKVSRWRLRPVERRAPWEVWQLRLRLGRITHCRRWRGCSGLVGH